MELDELEGRLEPFIRAKLGDDSACLLKAWKMPGHAGFSYGFTIAHGGGETSYYLRLPPPGVKLEGTADVLWKPQTASMNAAREHLKIEFGIGTDQFTELAQFCSEEVRMEAEIFGIHLDNLPDVKKLVAQAQAQYLEISLEAALDLDSLETVMEGPTPLM